MQAGEDIKFRYYSKIFAICVISLYSDIFGYNENFCFMFLGSNDPVMILFRIVWVFRLFVRLYKPCYELFVT